MVLIKKTSGVSPLAESLGGADGETRTPDLRITSALLYQLSHVSILFECACLAH